MSNWRDKNQNKSNIIACASSPVYTGATASGSVVLNDGSTGILIPANTLEVGDALEISLLYESTNVGSSTWELNFTSDASFVDDIHRRVMTAATASGYITQLISVTSTTLLEAISGSNAITPAIFTSAPIQHDNIDITNDITLTFRILAGGSSGSNTFTVNSCVVRHIKGDS